RNRGGSWIRSSCADAGPAAQNKSAAKRRVNVCSGSLCLGRWRVAGGHLLARGLEEVGGLGMAEPERKLHRGVAFLRDHGRIGAVPEQQLDHAPVALHGGV